MPPYLIQGDRDELQISFKTPKYLSIAFWIFYSTILKIACIKDNRIVFSGWFT